MILLITVWPHSEGLSIAPRPNISQEEQVDRETEKVTVEFPTSNGEISQIDEDTPHLITDIKNLHSPLQKRTGEKNIQNTMQ